MQIFIMQIFRTNSMRNRHRRQRQARSAKLLKGPGRMLQPWLHHWPNRAPEKQTQVVRRNRRSLLPQVALIRKLIHTAAMALRIGRKGASHNHKPQYILHRDTVDLIIRRAAADTNHAGRELSQIFRKSMTIGCKRSREKAKTLCKRLYYCGFRETRRLEISQ